MMKFHEIDATHCNLPKYSMLNGLLNNGLVVYSRLGDV